MGREERFKRMSIKFINKDIVVLVLAHIKHLMNWMIPECIMNQNIEAQGKG